MYLKYCMCMCQHLGKKMYILCQMSSMLNLGRYAECIVYLKHSLLHSPLHTVQATISIISPLRPTSTASVPVWVIVVPIVLSLIFIVIVVIILYAVSYSTSSVVVTSVHTMYCSACAANTQT